MRPRQDGHHILDDIFKCIFLNENVWILIIISMKLVPKVRINNIPALVQIMAWRRLGDKPLSESMVVSLVTHICVTRPQWINCINRILYCCEVSDRTHIFTWIHESNIMITISDLALHRTVYLKKIEDFLCIDRKNNPLQSVLIGKIDVWEFYVVVRDYIIAELFQVL